MSLTRPELSGFLLADCYLEQAERERIALSESQREALTTLDTSCDEGILLAWLHNIDVEMRAIGMERRQLAGRFDVYGGTAVSKWFSTGEIASYNFAKLITQPEFRHITVSEDDALVHGYRQIITKVRMKIVKESKKRIARISWYELVYLARLHQIDCQNVDEAFKRLPKALRVFNRDYNADWLLLAQRSWGRAYRLFALRMNDE